MKLLATVRRRILWVALSALPIGLGSSTFAADNAQGNWPQFRGPQSNGVSPSTSLPTEWSATKNIAWTADVPGLGWSSPVVWGEKIFLTTASRVAGDEKPQMGLYLGKSRGDGEHRFLVLCYDLASGRKLWEREVHRGAPQRIHLKNSFASATPATDGQRVVALFHDVGLFALDLEGQPLWSVPLPSRKTLADFGHGSSPVLYDGRVYHLADNEEDSSVAAYDATTGKELWRVSRDRQTTYATPFVWETSQGPQLVVPATKRTIAYDLAGQEVWSFTGGMSKLTICTPFAANGLLYVGSGYFQDPVRGLFAIKPGAHGDITLRDGATSSETIAWANLQAAPYNTSPLVYGDYLYVLYDRGFVGCFNAHTGQVIYEKQRLGGGFTASPWAHDGKIFCLNEDAETLVVQAGPEFKLLSRNPLEPEPCLATPALVGDSVILRTASHLYRIRAPESQSPKRAAAALPDSVEKRTVTIFSDGTRMVGDLYLPKERQEGQRLPAIIYCNGTGGVRQGAARFAAAAAQQGFAVLGFDYRGWGDSDSQLMALDPQPKPDAKGELTLRVRALRWQMNYTDQTEDIRAAISYLAGDPAIDSQRIGLLGTSYGGGLVTWMAAHDSRLKCVAAQVAGMGGLRTPAAIQRAYDLHTQQARSEAEAVPYETGKLGGKLATYDQMRVNPAKNIGFSAVEAAEKISIPMLIIDAEKEELMDTRENGGKVAQLLQQRGIPVKYHIMPSISHYGVYREAFAQTTKLELEWFAEQFQERR